MKSFAKNSLVAVAALVGSGSAAMAAPLLSIGDSVDVFFNGSTNVQWRSNLFYTDGVDNIDQNTARAVFGLPVIAPNISRPKVDAFVFYVSPGVEVSVGRNSNANITLYYRQDFLFYNRFSDDLNTSLANLYLDGNYNWGNLETSAGFSFVQTQQNTPQTNGFNFVANLVETDRYDAYIDADYDISPKAWVSAGFEWNRVDYTNNDDFFNRYADTDTYQAPVSFFWRVTPKLSVGPSFRFRYTDPSSTGGFLIPGTATPTATISSSDYFDYFFNLAVTGEVMPKLSLSLNLGYQFRDTGRDRVTTPAFGVPVSRNQGQRHQFAALFNAEYEVTPKLITFVNFAHDFGNGAEGQTTTNLGGDVGAIYNINSYLTANTQFGMELTDYQNSAGREDITTTTSVALNYSPDIYWQFSLGYYYINNNSSVNSYATPVGFSDNSGASFNAHTVNLQAALRY
ncbi:MAG: hypothetical protein AAFX93_13225 [Verrucomicrobiota bacterium]